CLEWQFSQQGTTELENVDDLCTLRDQIRSADHVELIGMLPDRELQYPAAHMSPCPYQRGEAGDGTDRLTSTVATLQSDADADRRRRRGRVFTGKSPYLVCRLPREQIGPFRRTGLSPFSQFVVAYGVTVDIILIDQPFADDDVHHRHRQCAGGTGFRCDMPVSFLCGLGCIATHADHLSTFFLRLLHDMPMVQIGRYRITCPDDDIFRMNEALGIDTRCRAYRQQPGCTGALATIGSFTNRSAQSIEERVTAV